MKKIVSVTLFTILALTMLLPVAGGVNAASVNHAILLHGNSMPLNGVGGTLVILRQGNPMPPCGTCGGH